MPVRPRRPSRGLPVVVLGLALTGCVPSTAAFLSIPVETDDELARDLVLVTVPLAELRERMNGFDPATLSFYRAGREPIPHRLVDEDGDGEPDIALVAIPVAADGSTRLIALCPGPPTTGALPASLPASTGVILLFDQSRR